MRTLPLITVLVVVTLPTLYRPAADEPRAIIEKAIRAAGGDAAVKKLSAVRATAKGTINIGADVPAAWVTTWQSPHQYKLSAELEVAGQKIALVQAFDGTTGWVMASGAVTALDGPRLREVRSQLHLRRVMMLMPLLTDQAYQLTELDDASIEGKPAVRVKVSKSGESDVTLCFEKSTGLPVKIEHMVLDNPTMKDVPQEDFLHNYQDVSGVKTAMKEIWIRAGKKVAEFDYTEVTYPEKIDPREFARPAGGMPTNLSVNRTADVIYGRKFGMALTMDVFTPKSGGNGIGVIMVMSGGWVSDSEQLNNQLIGNFVAEPVKRGYTVFTVFHGSQPKYVIPEAIADLNRAVRFIRHHARDYGIDPNRIGITGGSAGGHLSLMQGTAGDLGNAQASDVIDRESSRVQAVACLFPPTDFLNYGGEGKYAFGLDGLLAAFRPAVDARELDPKTFRLERTSDEKKQLELATKISPISHATSDDPPTLIIHGDADKLVPIQQAERLVAKFKGAGVPAELITRKGRGHDFAGIDKDVTAMSDWFDKYLRKK